MPDGFNDSKQSGSIKRYMIILEIKPEHLKEYCDIHRHPWPELLEAIKGEGAKELLLWNYKNLSIVYYETEDIDELYAKLNKIDAIKRWNATVGPWIEVSPPLDGSGKMNTCEKIFDLNQQIDGKLAQY
jgi:L-rhamnose mutarotase